MNLIQTCHEKLLWWSVEAGDFDGFGTCCKRCKCRLSSSAPLSSACLQLEKIGSTGEVGWKIWFPKNSRSYIQSSSSHEKNPRVPQMLFWNNLRKKNWHGLEARVSSGMHSLGLQWKGNGFWKTPHSSLTGALFELFITAECFSTT